MYTKNKKLKAVLHSRKLRGIGNFIMKMRSIELMMGNKPLMYPSPNPPLPTFALHIDELEAAETEASRHTTGSTTTRDIKYNQVLRDVHSLQMYVQRLATEAETEDEARIIIENSGFDIKRYGERVRPEFEVRNTKISGIVKLIAKRPGKISSNNWEMSGDGIDWIPLPTTEQAKTTVKGLKPGTEMHFRHQPVTKSGEGNWSQIVTIIVA